MKAIAICRAFIFSVNTYSILRFFKNLKYLSSTAKVLITCFLLTFNLVAYGQNKLSIFGGYQGTKAVVKFLILPDGLTRMGKDYPSNGLTFGLQYKYNLHSIGSISTDIGYASYSYLMSYDKTKIEHQYLQMNSTLAVHPFYKSSI